MSNYTITEDILFKNYMRSKPNISEATKTHYKAALTKFYKAVNEPLQTIITNCKNQQGLITEKTIFQGKDSEGNEIIQKQTVEFDVNSPESYINIYINTFIDYCKETNIKTNSINNYLTQILAVLSFYNIKLPTIEKFDRTPSRWNLLTKEDFKFIINDCTLMYKGLIKLLMSNGMRLSDALSLTVGDFMKATSEYHNFVNVNEFIDNAPQNMIGYWKFNPGKTQRFKIECQTFNDPETSNLILQHLRKLKDEYYPGKNLEPSKDDPLFGSQKAYFKRNLTQDSVSDTLHNKNKKLRNHHIALIEEKIEKGELSKEDKQREIEKIPKFHAHACRKYFETMVAKNCGNLRICAMLEGHTAPLQTDNSYIKLGFDEIKEAYMAVIPDLSLENTETKTYTSEIRREMENKISKLEQENKELKQENKDAIQELWDAFNSIEKRNEIWENEKGGKNNGGNR